MFSKIKDIRDIELKTFLGMFVILLGVMLYFTGHWVIAHREGILYFFKVAAIVLCTFGGAVAVSLLVGVTVERYVFPGLFTEDENARARNKEYAASVPMAMVIVDDLYGQGSSGRFFVKNGNIPVDVRMDAATEEELVRAAQIAAVENRANALCVYNVEKDVIKSYLRKKGRNTWDETVATRATRALSSFRELAVTNQRVRDGVPLSL